MPYLCFDIGSSSLKAGLISETGDLLGFASRPLSILHGPEGAHESDANAWIEAAFSAGSEAVTSAKKRALALSGSEPEVRAISVSGNGPSLVPVDASGLPIGLALSWLDGRAIAEAAEVSALAGATIDPTFYLPKALRLWRGAEESARARIRWFFSCPEYIVFRLCGEAITYLPHPAFEPYVWNSAMIEALDLPAERFPPFTLPARRVGEILPEAARKLGLPQGIPLVAGYPDFLAAILGSASVSIGIACDRTGSSEAINLCADRPFPRRDLLSLPHPVAGLWNLSGGLSSAGIALDWAAKLGKFQAVVDGASSVDALIDEARLSPPGARGLVFLPYLSGERAPLWDPSRRGAFVGLSLTHSRIELARAVCESLAYGLRMAADLAREENYPFDLLRASGSLGQVDFLSEIKADVLGVPLEVPEIAECELVGDAIDCALALGDQSDLAEASRAIVRIRRRFEPNFSRAYEEAYDKYQETVEALAIVDAPKPRRDDSSITEPQ